MSDLDTLRGFVNERLAAAAEEIFGLFARTVTEYDDELSRLKQENERQRKLLRVVLSPEVRLVRADVQPEAEAPQLKEEQEQLSNSWDADLLKSLVPGQSEDVKEEAPSSLLYQRHTEPPFTSPTHHRGTEVEDLGGSEPVCSADPQTFLQATNSTETVCERADTSDMGWNGIREPQAQLKPLHNTGVSEFDHEPNSDIELAACSECGKTFDAVVQCYMQNPLGEFVCSICVKESTRSSHLVIQKKTYSEANAFICRVCKKQFSTKSDTVRHMRTHTEEKPFGCSICGQRFNQSSGLSTHMRTHTADRPFACCICSKQFMRSGVLARHMRVHTGEKPYTCSVCNTSFSLSQSLSKHMRIHTGEKPFSCLVCGKRFTQKGHLTQHMPLHTGERLFSCHVCGKSFSRQSRVKKHKCVPHRALDACPKKPAPVTFGDVQKSS